VKWFIEKRSGEFILQQFVDHDETFFKIFVIGSNISIFRRKSIGSNSAQFNSQGGVFAESLDGLGDITRAQQSELELIATEITSMFSTSLLGIDVLRGDSRFFVVDINYFPSYNELGPMFRTLMDRYCRELVRLS
jgi:glutathione synthase/RimK-type ligase-like ATP-grasp enzyme